jgi:3-hydroxyacyl-CoA dehydrogenase
MINHIGIIGGGKMGTGIFYFLSDFPYQITWIFRTQNGMKKAKESWVKKQLRAIKFEQTDEITYKDKLDRIQFANDLSRLINCDLIIECISEDFEAKSRLFGELDAITKPSAIFSSNTSSIPIGSMVPSDQRKDKFIGLHFFYPVRYKNLLEVNLLHETSVATMDSMFEFLNTIKKFYKVLHEKDHFLFNRLFLKLQAGVYTLYEEDKIPIETLDNLVKEKLFPVGVFEFFDLVGIDVMHTAVTNYSLTTPDQGDIKNLIMGLKRLRDTNHLGVKSGQGFYDYSSKKDLETQAVQKSIDFAERNVILKKIQTWYLIPIFEAIKNQVVSKQEAEQIVKEYMDVSMGPIELANEIGFIP